LRERVWLHARIKRGGVLHRSYATWNDGAVGASLNIEAHSVQKRLTVARIGKRLQATREAADSRGCLPVVGQRLETTPQLIGANGTQRFVEVCDLLLAGSGIDARVKIAGSDDRQAMLPVGTAEKVTMIDKEGVKPAAGVFFEDGLAIVDMIGAGIDQPGEPKAISVQDVPEC